MDYSLVFRFNDSCVFHFMTFESLDEIHKYIGINYDRFDMYYICKNLEYKVFKSWK